MPNEPIKAHACFSKPLPKPLAPGSRLRAAGLVTGLTTALVGGWGCEGCEGPTPSPAPAEAQADAGTAAVGDGQQGAATVGVELVAGPMLVARRGTKTRVEVQVRRNGVIGPLRLELGSLPLACRAESVVLAADDTDTTLELDVPPEASYGGPWDVKLSATSTSSPSVRAELVLVLYVASEVGTEDASFHVRVDPTTNSDWATVAARDPSGRLLVGGIGSSSSGTYAAAKPWVMRLLPSGAVDTTFGDHGVLVPAPEAEFAVVTALGAGAAGSPSEGPAGVRVGLSLTDGRDELRATDAMVLAYDETGVLDTGFGVGGAARVGASIVRGASTVKQIAPRRSGSFVAVEPSPGRVPALTESTLWSLDDRGTLVRHWRSVRTASAITRTPDDHVVTSEILRSGEAPTSIGLRRRDARGALDATFGEHGTLVLPKPYGERAAWVRGIELERDGSGAGVALVVWPATVEEPRSAGLVRFSASGSIDQTFGEHGVRMVGDTGGGETLMALDDGRWLVLAKADGPTRTSVRRFHRDGTPDTSFADDGELVLDGPPDVFVYAGAPDRLYRMFVAGGGVQLDRIWL